DREPRSLDRLARRHRRVARDALVGARDVPLANAGALDDPLIGGVEHPLEIGVGEDSGRRGRSHARGHGTRHWRHAAGVASCAASSASMCAVSPPRTASAALPIAHITERALVEPWQMMVTPRTPSSGAPPYSDSSKKRRSGCIPSAFSNDALCWCSSL